MASISYIKFYTYLVEEAELTPLEAIRTINRVRNLDPQIKNALIDWFNQEDVSLTISDISFDELVNDEGFTPIRAFLFLDWIKREPAQAMRYMAIERFTQSTPPSEDLQLRLRETLQKDGKPKPSDISDDDKSDITSD